MLNRSALILRPAQPYIDWAAGFDPTLLPDPDGEQTVYLLPPVEGEGQLMEILEDIWADLFATELEGWHTDEAAWPQQRTFEMFKRWFVIEWHSMVLDLCGGAIVDDEFEDEEGEKDA